MTIFTIQIRQDIKLNNLPIFNNIAELRDYLEQFEDRVIPFAKEEI